MAEERKACVCTCTCVQQCYQPGEKNFSEHGEWDLGACPPEKIEISLKMVHSLHFGSYILINLQCLVFSFSGTME